MKRSSFLAPLSREHHGALVLAKRIAALAPDEAALSQMCERVVHMFQTELVPHFAEEERYVLPALAHSDAGAVQRTLDEHAALADLAARVGAGDRGALMAFGLLLAQHVRFEERELFALFDALQAETPA